MKAMDIIDRLDLLEPNDYSPEQKLHWLSTLDGKATLEVIATHSKKRHGIPTYQTGDEELLIQAPFGEDIYYYYLQAMVAAENGETQRYNKRILMFNNAYTEWTNWYNRTHLHASSGKQFLF